MDCEQVRDRAVRLLQAGGGPPWPAPLAGHLESCQGCRQAVEGLSLTWALLGQWPEAEPDTHLRAKLLRRVRRELVRESVLTLKGWAPAVLTSATGVGLSLALSLLVPYSVLVTLCRQALQVSDLSAAPFLLAGMAYGVPLALGVWILRRQALTGAVIGSLEASLLFLVMLAPYVIAQCREFAPPLQAAFVSGLAVGAVTSSLVGLWLARLVPFGGVHHA
jgi:hypothetical protein